jgi:glucokinase
MRVLACDMGGTRIKYGIVEDGVVLAQDGMPAHSDRGLAPRLPALAEALLQLCVDNGMELASCAGVGMSFPSLIDVRSGRVLAEFGKYSDAMDVDIRAWSRDALHLPLAIENDARMALIGEWRSGAGRGCDNLVMMTLGTGLGVSAVIEGRVLRGAHGQAGILGGHLTVNYRGAACHCGNIGCAESEASSVVLEHLARQRGDFAGSALATEPVLDYAAIFRWAGVGDACAAALREHSLRVWSANAVNLVHAFDPELIVLGGGIMASGAVIVDAVQEYVDAHAMTPWGRVRVAASELGDQAALVACEWLVEEHRREGWLD